MAATPNRARLRLGVFALVVMLCGVGCSSRGTRSSSPAPPSATPNTMPTIVVHAYDAALTGVRTGNTGVLLHVERATDLADELVLVVDYPAPNADPAGRDVRLDATSRDWTAGNAIAFRVKPTSPTRLSLSFIDRHHVVYTAWTDLQAGSWQPVRLEFAGLRPNPYFQPPDARTGQPIDVSDVEFIAFAPQDRSAGRLAISRILVVK